MIAISRSFSVHFVTAMERDASVTDPADGGGPFN